MTRINLADPDIEYAERWYYSSQGQPYAGRENGIHRVYALRTDTPGASVEFDFVGTRVTLLHKYGQIRWWDEELDREAETLFGKVFVLIDGKPATMENGGVLPADGQGRAVLDTGKAKGPTLLAENLPLGKLQFPDWAGDGILDYNKLVQPVWDKCCLDCHDGPAPDGGLDLCGESTHSVKSMREGNNWRTPGRVFFVYCGICCLATMNFA